MNFSLLIPTRGRVERLKVLLKSIDDNTYDKRSVEVMLAYDTDDKYTEMFIVSELPKLYPDLQIRVFSRQRSAFINKDYYNWLAGFSTGNFLWVMGDDLQILSKNWDFTALDKLEKYLENKPDRVVYGNIDDGTPPPRDSPKIFCCFPIISREAYTTLGCIFHDEIASWGADHAIYAIYGSPEIDRLCNILDVKIDHISHHKYGEKYRDATSVDVETSYRKMGGGSMVAQCIQNRVPEQVRKLKVRINGMVRQKQV